MLSIIVKGTRFEAARAAANRGIPFAFVYESSEHRETIGHVGDQHEAKVAAWFCEDAGREAPYPIGSLLLYSTIEDGSCKVLDAREEILLGEDGAL